jgi:hypothetical protein
MIYISLLTPEDVGRYVIYKDGTGKKEQGRIKSWKDPFVFVVYKCNGEWDRFKEFTGEATRPEDLIFVGESFEDNKGSKGVTYK